MLRRNTTSWPNEMRKSTVNIERNERTKQRRQFRTKPHSEHDGSASRVRRSGSFASFYVQQYDHIVYIWRKISNKNATEKSNASREPYLFGILAENVRNEETKRKTKTHFVCEWIFLSCVLRLLLPRCCYLKISSYVHVYGDRILCVCFYSVGFVWRDCAHVRCNVFLLQSKPVLCFYIFLFAVFDSPQVIYYCIFRKPTIASILCGWLFSYGRDEEEEIFIRQVAR